MITAFRPGIYFDVQKIYYVILRVFLAIWLLLQVLIRSRKHQLNTIELVDLRSARIVVNRHNIRLRILLADCLNNTLADNMVRQARERLDADDIVNIAVDQLDRKSVV